MEILNNLALFGNVTLGILFLVLGIIIICALEYNEEGGYAIIPTIILIGLSYFFGDNYYLNVLTFKGAFLYLIIGFIYSLIRTYFKGKRLTAEQKARFDLRLSVMRWLFWWPFSIIALFFGDFLDMAWSKIYSLFQNLYSKVFNM